MKVVLHYCDGFSQILANTQQTFPGIDIWLMAVFGERPASWDESRIIQVQPDGSFNTQQMNTEDICQLDGGHPLAIAAMMMLAMHYRCRVRWSDRWVKTPWRTEEPLLAYERGVGGRTGTYQKRELL